MFRGSETLELSAHCISGKLGAAILGKPSGENLAEPMKMPVSGSVTTSLLRENRVVPHSMFDFHRVKTSSWL